MDGSNIWTLVKENKKRIPKSPSGTEQLLDVEAAADAAELPSEELSFILDEMVRQESEKKSHRGRSPTVQAIKRIGSKLMDKVRKRSQHPSTADISTIAISEIGISQQQVPSSPHTTPIFEIETPLFPEVDEASPSYRSSFRYPGTPIEEEKCAYLFRGDSMYLKTEADGARESSSIATNADKVERVHVYDPFCPVHGSRRRLVRRAKIRDFDYHLTSIESVDDTEPSGVILLSQAFAAKLIRKRRRALLSGAEKYRNDKAKRKIMVNLWTVSLSFLFLFTAFHGLQNLQTSINGHLGADNLAMFYASLSISYLFVPSFILNRLGCKRTLIGSCGIFMIYMLSNFLPKYYSLIPAAILAGCAGSCLWAAKCVYILESGTRYAHLNVEAQNVVIIRFFGYFFMVLHMGQVIGNLISSLILTAAIGYHKPKDRVENGCGHRFRENDSLLSEEAIQNLRRPPENAYLSVCGIYFCCTIIALMIVLLFLNSLRKDEIARLKAPFYSPEIFRTVCRNFLRPRPLLLVPLTFYSGVEQAFAVGLYTKAYVGCGLGISQIGFVMTSFGVTDAVCSLVFGPLMKLFGRMPLFVFGAVINMLMIMTLLIWPLNPGDTALFYAIAGVWGMADGVWNTQINGFWVALSGNNLEAAFANYRFWESLGFAIGLVLVRFTGIEQFLYISLAMLLVGILAYLGVEFYDNIYSYLKKMGAVCVETRKGRTSGKGRPRQSMETSLISATSAQAASEQTKVMSNQSSVVCKICNYCD